MDGVCAYVDDIIVWGSIDQEHNQRLTKVLEQIQRNGLKVKRKTKRQFGV